MLCFKVSLTYQKQLLKSCVCSLDILQRWKAAWQVIHLQELIGRFANCLIDSKSNNQEIKAFCFTSQIMHQLLSLKTKLIGMISQRAVIPEDKTLWKASDLHAFFNTVWKLAYRLVTRFDAFNYDTNKIILAPIYAVMNITSTTWFLLLFLQYFVHCTHQNHFTRRLLDLYPERRDRQKQPNLPAAAYNFSWLLPSRFWYLAARSSNESHKEEIIWIQTRQYILHLPIYLLFFFSLKERKKYKARWCFGLDSEHSLSFRFQSSDECQCSKYICCHTGLFIIKPGKSCSRLILQKWALVDTSPGRTVLCFLQAATQKPELRAKGIHIRNKVTRPTGGCISQIQYFFQMK